MKGVLVDCDPRRGSVDFIPVHFEGCPGRYGRFDCLHGYERDEIYRYFSNEMRDHFAPRPFAIARYDNPEIKKVIFNDPATVVIWSDNTKTVVKCQPGDTYDAEKGLALCISKKFLGNKGNFNEVFKKWIPEEVSIDDMKEALNDYCGTRKGCSDCMFSDINCDNDCLSEEEIKRQYEMLKNKEV